MGDTPFKERKKISHSSLSTKARGREKQKKLNPFLNPLNYCEHNHIKKTGVKETVKRLKIKASHHIRKMVKLIKEQVIPFTLQSISFRFL